MINSRHPEEGKSAMTSAAPITNRIHWTVDQLGNPQLRHGHAHGSSVIALNCRPQLIPSAT
jgi:hypothetical protein